MKKVILSWVAIATFGFVSAQETSNKPIFGAKAGVNLATLTGEDSDGAETRTSIHAGMFVEFKITDKFSIQPELLYSAKGTKASGFIEGIQADIVMKLNYIEIPVMFRYYVVDKFSLEAGPYVGFIAAAKMKVDTSMGGGTADIKDTIKSTDFGLGVGASYDVLDNLFINFRYSMGLSEVGDSGSGDDIKNSVVQFGLGYKF